MWGKRAWRSRRIWTGQVPFGAGSLAVRDHGGPEPVVLFVHAVGLSVLNWDLVAARLRGRCRAIAFDLPGHGRSETEVRSWQDPWRAVVAIARGLDLDRPLVVAHDTGTSAAIAALIREPGLFRGGVGIGGSAARSPQATAEWLAFARSDIVADNLRQRFRLGMRGIGQAAADRLVDEIAAKATRDWVTAPIVDLRQEIVHSIRYAPDGWWEHRPRTGAIKTIADIPEDSDLFPDESSYARLRVPWWLVHLGRGYDADAAQRQREIVAQQPHLRLVELATGQWQQHTHPREVADLVVDIAADPGREPLRAFPPDRPAC